MGSMEPHHALKRTEIPQDRSNSVWRTWLEALASDAEAALGAALAYQELNDAGRGAVIDALESDSKLLTIPRVALFAPLLSVERDESRRARIRNAMGDDVGVDQSIPPRALMGTTPNGDKIIVVHTHVYLNFVRATLCRLIPNHRITWVRSEPLIHVKDMMPPSSDLEGAAMDLVSMRTAIDAIAQAIVGQRRQDGQLPESLHPLVELFDASLCDE